MLSGADHYHTITCEVDGHNCNPAFGMVTDLEETLVFGIAKATATQLASWTSIQRSCFDLEIPPCHLIQTQSEGLGLITDMSSQRSTMLTDFRNWS